MTADQLPLEVVAALALVAWALLIATHLHDAHRVRRHDRDTQRRALRVLVEGMADRETDHDVKGEQAHGRADDPADDEHDVHAGRVAA